MLYSKDWEEMLTLAENLSLTHTVSSAFFVCVGKGNKFYLGDILTTYPR